MVYRVLLFYFVMLCIGLFDGVVGKFCSFFINICDVGYGGFGLLIEGFFKVEIKCIDNEDGICFVEYFLFEFGKYNINVKFVDEDVFGSFFILIVGFLGDELI